MDRPSTTTEPKGSLEALGMAAPVIESLEAALRFFRAARTAEANAPKRRALSELRKRTKAITEGARALEDALRRAGELDPRLLHEISKDFENLTRDEDDEGSTVKRGAMDAVVDANSEGRELDRRLIRAAGAFPEGLRLDQLRRGVNALERLTRARAGSGDREEPNVGEHDDPGFEKFKVFNYSKPTRLGPGKDQYRATFAVNIGLILKAAGYRLMTTPKGETSAGGMFYRVAAVLFKEAREIPPNAKLLADARDMIRSGEIRRGHIVELMIATKPRAE